LNTLLDLYLYSYAHLFAGLVFAGCRKPRYIYMIGAAGKERANGEDGEKKQGAL
jgi:hypothetical protein